MAKPKVQLTNTFNEWRLINNQLSDLIGDLALTYDPTKLSLVDLINHLHANKLDGAGGEIIGPLSVTGNGNFGGTLNSVGSFSVATNKFNVDALNGNTLIAGTLNVAGITSLGQTSTGLLVATSLNKVTVTQPASGATLTLADGSTLITTGAYSTTLNVTGITSLTLPTTGTLSTLAGSEALTNKTVNGLTLTSNATGFSLAGGTTSKTLTVSNSITLAGTDATTITLPATSGTVALNNQTMYIGTTAVAINRASASLSLTGVPSVNGISLTPNATGFSLAGGTTSKTLTISNTLTLSGTDGSTLNIGAGGTLGTGAYATIANYVPTSFFAAGAVMEVGRYFDMHAAANGFDYDARIEVAAGGTSGTGTLTFTAANAVFSGGATFGASLIRNIGGATLSGLTAATLTGIPSWANRITIVLQKVSATDSSHVIIRVGTSSTIATTGYLSIVTQCTTSSASTGNTFNGILLATTPSATAIINACITLTKAYQSVDNWIVSMTGSMDDVSDSTVTGSGYCPNLGSGFDRIQITTIAGTNAFDGGYINVYYE